MIELILNILYGASIVFGVMFIIMISAYVFAKIMMAFEDWIER